MGHSQRRWGQGKAWWWGLILGLLGWGWLLGMPTALAVPPPQGTSNLEQVAQAVTEFRLGNGLKFIVLERHFAPVVACLTYAKIGAVHEPEGKTGVAHFLEHLAFKGTQRIGTRNYQAEAPLLEQLDRLDEERRRAQAGGDEPRAIALTAQMAKVQEELGGYGEPNEFGRIVEQAGGVGLNATTSTDATRYFYRFPSNKLELWMSLESERFLEPVFRDFFTEKEVILEERRSRVDNSPVGQMVEALQATAFQVHPYRRPVIGYERDLRNLSRRDIQTFFDAYYGPQNLTMVVVGDVNPQEVQRLAQIYFGRFQARPQNLPPLPPEPPQTAPRQVTLRFPSQPWYFEAYHRPGMTDPDHHAYEVMVNLLSQGRTSRLYRTLVAGEKLALDASGFSGLPGDLDPNLMVFYALTAPDHGIGEVAIALQRELGRLQQEPVTERELARVKHQARAGLLQSLKSNLGMASALAEFEVKRGSWRQLFQEPEAIAQVTAADVQRVAQTIFRPENRTVGQLLPLEEIQP